MIQIIININLPKDEEIVLENQQQLKREFSSLSRVEKPQIIRKSLGAVPRPSAEELAKQNNPRLKEEEEAWEEGMENI